jgi:catechol 2,3-dioxygenase-like lactoylglutathione lyase family enzyme
LNDAKIIAFVGATSVEQARVFYEDVLELELEAEEPSALVFDANGTMLRVSIVPDLEPLPFMVLGWEVGDLRSEVDALRERGVVFEQFPGFEQDSGGITAFSDGTEVAWFRDPDGNLLSLSQF